jgi:hypothetical protein
MYSIGLNIASGPSHRQGFPLQNLFFIVLIRQAHNFQLVFGVFRPERKEEAI